MLRPIFKNLFSKFKINFLLAGVFLTNNFLLILRQSRLVGQVIEWFKHKIPR